VSTVSRPALFVAVGVIALGAVGCGSSGNNSSSKSTTTASSAAGTTTGGPNSTAATGGTDSIAIQNFKFSPDPLSVKQGAKVTVAILDAHVRHSVNADDRSFDTQTIDRGKSKSVTFSKAGSFAYHCDFHPFMKAMVVVK